MKALLLVVCILVVLIWLARILRRREQQAFLDPQQKDAALIASMRNNDSERDSGEGTQNARDVAIDPLLTRAHEYLAAKENRAISTNGNLFKTAQLKDIILSEHHRRLMASLDMVLSDEYRYFVNLPLVDFLVPAMLSIKNLSVSFLICERQYLKAVAAIEFGHVSDAQNKVIKESLNEVNLPLIFLPKAKQYPHQELQRLIAGVIPLVQKSTLVETAIKNCQVCGKSMRKRRLKKSGVQNRIVWVCSDYPQCKVIRPIS